MEKTIINNIYFSTNELELLKTNISKYQNQNLHIITSPEYCKQTDMFYNALKREYKINISYVPKLHCYNLTNLNTIWCGQKENTRLIIAIGDEHVHNLSKLLSAKSNIPYCFIGYDMPNIFALNTNGIVFHSNPCLNQPAECLLKIYNLKNANNETCAYTLAQTFSLLLLPFEDYVNSKINNTKLNYACNQKLLHEINMLFDLINALSMNIPKAFKTMAKSIIRISCYLQDVNSYVEIFDIAQKYVFQNNIDVKYLGLFQLFTGQVIIKLIKTYFDNNLVSPISIPFECLIKIRASKEIYKALTLSTQNKQNIDFFYKTNYSFLQNWINKLDNLQQLAIDCIRKISNDAGLNAYKIIDYKNFLSFIKYRLLEQQSPLLDCFNLVEII